MIQWEHFNLLAQSAYKKHFRSSVCLPFRVTQLHFETTMSCSSMRYLNVMIIVHIQHTVCNGKYAQVAFRENVL